MARQFITVDYAATLKQTVTLAECLPADHLARFIVGIIALYPLNNRGEFCFPSLAHSTPCQCGCA